MAPSADQVATATVAWQTRGSLIALDRPIVLGILNVTPDSFSDGGMFTTIDSALARVDRMVVEGADAIDVGGESTRPQGTRVVGLEEELARVIPVVRAIRRRFPDTPLSVDTTKSEVALAAVQEGVNIVNDVSAFRVDPRMGEIAASTRVGVILMHSRGGVEEMATYQHANYGIDVVGEVIGELEVALRAAISAGVTAEAIVVDPGIGFAKRSQHSLELLAELQRFSSLGRPIVVGVSRKRFIGELSRVARASDRVAGTVGANVAALMNGARLFRVHDVGPNRQALDVAWGVLHPDVASAARSAVPDSSSRFPVPRSQRP
jgi:dihydropteroate synthase